MTSSREVAELRFERSGLNGARYMIDQKHLPYTSVERFFRLDSGWSTTHYRLQGGVRPIGRGGARCRRGYFLFAARGMLFYCKAGKLGNRDQILNVVPS